MNVKFAGEVSTALLELVQILLSLPSVLPVTTVLVLRNVLLVVHSTPLPSKISSLRLPLNILARLVLFLLPSTFGLLLNVLNVLLDSGALHILPRHQDLAPLVTIVLVVLLLQLPFLALLVLTTVPLVLLLSLIALRATPDITALKVPLLKFNALLVPTILLKVRKLLVP